MGITARVGDPRRGGINRLTDVLAVQSALNNWILFWALKGASPVLTAGSCDRAMVRVTGAFQRIVVGMSSPDHRIDPNGRTWRLLSGPVKVSGSGRTDHTPREVLQRRAKAAIEAAHDRFFD
jgi:hypothetical protein